MNKKIENIETIKRAIEVEVEHRYIDIRGRTCPFSQFILGELKNIQRMDKTNYPSSHLHSPVLLLPIGYHS